MQVLFREISEGIWQKNATNYECKEIRLKRNRILRQRKKGKGGKRTKFFLKKHLRIFSRGAKINFTAKYQILEEWNC